jgi:hypothetical protein
MNDIAFDPETGEVIEPQPAPASKPRRSRKKRGNGRTPIPADETKRQKFVRLANHRFDRVVKAMHILRSLGRNQGSYEYGDADVDQITDKLVAELEAMAAEMKRRGRPIQTKLDLQ